MKTNLIAKKKIVALVLAGTFACSAFAKGSSYVTPEPAPETIRSRVCLVQVGNNIVNGNAFTGLKHYVHEGQIQTHLYFGSMTATVVNTNMTEAQRWTNSFSALLRSLCGAI